MQIVAIADTTTTRQSGDNSLHRRKTLLTDNIADGLNFRFIRTEYQSGDAALESPRHHLAFQQICFAEAGSVNYAPGHNIP
ncbi:uncharacterized protein N7477_003832 [Penicillium maclennaniae]|uniref:uncharacterized protein n=1 Tax=Penicillium maclennaniae TaxID=1343394 RepID=UPI002540A8D3|nr:uncharacterized protein N7477_003832 [Penicillium maclennaniae]KAJ5678199.1 hypothetical protein N7477_003832 [Penicillium maclennaniae]